MYIYQTLQLASDSWGLGRRISTPPNRRGYRPQWAGWAQLTTRPIDPFQLDPLPNSLPLSLNCGETWFDPRTRPESDLRRPTHMHSAAFLLVQLIWVRCLSGNHDPLLCRWIRLDPSNKMIKYGLVLNSQTQIRSTLLVLNPFFLFPNQNVATSYIEDYFFCYSLVGERNDRAENTVHWVDGVLFNWEASSSSSVSKVMKLVSWIPPIHGCARVQMVRAKVKQAQLVLVRCFIVAKV